MRDVIYRELGLKPVVWEPQHTNKLGNTFYFYTNLQDVSKLGGYQD